MNGFVRDGFGCNPGRKSLITDTDPPLNLESMAITDADFRLKMN